MGTPIDWGAWANQAYSAGMDILKNQIGGKSTYGGKTYNVGTPNPTPVSGVKGFFSKISVPMIAAIGVAVLAVFTLLKRRK